MNLIKKVANKMSMSVVELESKMEHHIDGAVMYFEENEFSYKILIDYESNTAKLLNRVLDDEGNMIEMKRIWEIN